MTKVFSIKILMINIFLGVCSHAWARKNIILKFFSCRGATPIVGIVCLVNVREPASLSAGLDAAMSSGTILIIDKSYSYIFLLAWLLCGYVSCYKQYLSFLHCNSYILDTETNLN
jgi:hypothetical protein